MDINLLNKLKSFKVILATNSPRRQQLFNDIGFQFTKRVIETDETLLEGLSPSDQVMNLAKQKALAQRHLLKNDELIIAADTIVVQNNVILGKPKNSEEAKSFLRAYSGNSHKVLSGVCLYTSTGIHTFYEETTVYFNTISESVIESYLGQNTYSDKAGAYGIQDSIGKWSISKIDGCYYNVMGFPMSKFITELSQFLNHE